MGSHSWSEIQADEVKSRWVFTWVDMNFVMNTFFNNSCWNLIYVLGKAIN